MLHCLHVIILFTDGSIRFAPGMSSIRSCLSRVHGSANVEVSKSAPDSDARVDCSEDEADGGGGTRGSLIWSVVSESRSWLDIGRRNCLSWWHPIYSLQIIEPLDFVKRKGGVKQQRRISVHSMLPTDDRSSCTWPAAMKQGLIALTHRSQDQQAGNLPLSFISFRLSTCNFAARPPQSTSS